MGLLKIDLYKLYWRKSLKEKNVGNVELNLDFDRGRLGPLFLSYTRSSLARPVLFRLVFLLVLFKRRMHDKPVTQTNG